MEKRQYGTNPMAECRRDSHEKVNKRQRYAQIIQVLKPIKTGLTAREIAAVMCKKGFIPTDERNYVSPRLTELCEKGVVEPIGKRICLWTGKKVTVYVLRNEV